MHCSLARILEGWGSVCGESSAYCILKSPKGSIWKHFKKDFGFVYHVRRLMPEKIRFFIFEKKGLAADKIHYFKTRKVTAWFVI